MSGLKPVEMPTVIERLQVLDQLLANGLHRRARAEAGQILATAPSTANCQAISARLDRLDAAEADLTPVRIALLSNFTIDPLVPVLRARALMSGLHVRCYVPGFDVWQQEALDPHSGLRAFDPGVIVLDLHPERLLPSLFDDALSQDAGEVAQLIEDSVSRIAGILSSLREWSTGKIMVHALAAPLRRPLGILDREVAVGTTAALSRLNKQLAEACQTIANVHLLDTSAVVALVGAAAWMDRRLWTLAKLPYGSTALHALVDEQLRFVRAFTGRVRKVLVFDLDGTLWGGVVGEDDIAGIQLGDEHPGRAYLEIQRVARELRRRGVLLALNSKNNEDDALAVIDTHPAMLLRRDAFAAMRINWRDKVDNLIDIASDLGLGLDSFVFVDDSATECERVRQALPEVYTVHLTGEPTGWADALRRLGVFDALSYNDEDRRRAAFYQTEGQRKSLERQVTSVEEFYASLGMTLTAERLGPQTLARAADLTQRTNQFNLTTTRFTPAEMQALAARPDVDTFIFRLADAFGDYGFIAVAVVNYDGSRSVITTLLMSCRVLQRTVEDTVMAFIARRARERGATVLDGLFAPTRKNGLVASFYADRGFQAAGTDPDGSTRYTRSLDLPFEPSAWVTLNDAETVA